jgi:hypothetical protein
MPTGMPMTMVTSFKPIFEPAGIAISPRSRS